VFSKWMESVQEPQQGWIDFRAWRVAVTGDPIPWMVADGEYRTGPPGSSVSGSVTTVQVWPPRAGDPLWLLDLLRGAETAVEETSEPVGGVTCTRFAVQADLCKADAQARFPMAVPNDVRLVRELAQLPLELWLDDEKRIRRVRSGLTNRLSVSFSDFGVEIPIDWTVMPPADPLDREA